MPVDETDTLFARFRRDEHDDFQPVAVGYGVECFHIVPEGEVGDDDPVYPAVRTALAKGFETIMEDGVEVSHQYQGDFHVLPDVFQLLEEAVQAHAVLLLAKRLHLPRQHLLLGSVQMIAPVLLCAISLAEIQLQRVAHSVPV